MSTSFNELYQPLDQDDELFLTSVPLSLLEEGIRRQFEDPSSDTKVDYVDTFISRYHFSKDNEPEEEDNLIEDLHDRFIKFMLDSFQETFNIGFNNFDDKSLDDQHQLIHFVYRFFIRNIKKNFVNLIMNYIERNRDEIEPLLSKSKNVIYCNFKSEISDEYYVLVLSNLSTVVTHILSEDFDVDTFLDYISDSDLIEVDYMKSVTDSFDVTGNFVPLYIGLIDTYLKQELTNKVRKRILSKFPDRKKEEFKIEED